LIWVFLFVFNWCFSISFLINGWIKNWVSIFFFHDINMILWSKSSNLYILIWIDLNKLNILSLLWFQAKVKKANRISNTPTPVLAYLSLHQPHHRPYLTRLFLPWPKKSHDLHINIFTKSTIIMIQRSPSDTSKLKDIFLTCTR
jgi:hypothetical protein